MENLNLIGEFETKGILIVTDPCYDKATWCTGKIEVKPGKYKVYIKRSLIASWGERICALYIVHENENLKNLTFTKTKIDVGVDSGQAGFFNKEMFGKELLEPVLLTGEKEYEDRNALKSLYLFKTLLNSEHFSPDSRKNIQEVIDADEKQLTEEYKTSKNFYEVCCSLTSSNQSVGIEKFGVVANSGYGDGCYSCYINEGEEIVASYIEFITEEKLGVEAIDCKKK